MLAGIIFKNYFELVHFFFFFFEWVPLTIIRTPNFLPTTTLLEKIDPRDFILAAI